MIREAFEYLIGLGNTQIEYVGDRVYSTQKMFEVPAATPGTLKVRSLSGMVEYLLSKFDGSDKLMIHVSSPTEVLAFSTFNRDFARNILIKAEAMIPDFTFDRFYDTESFNVKLQSVFVKNDDRDVMLKVVGNIREESVKSVGDDGISQSVTAKVGVSTVAQAVVPNPVVVKPYRTFTEVDQPASEFIFRMKSGPQCALFEADGGAWKLEAMKNIQSYLAEKLAREIESGNIIIIA